MKQTSKSSLALDIKHLVVSVEGKEILKGISLQIPPGEVHAVMGPNGSGKSTLAYSLMGHPAYQIETGKKSGIWLNGVNLLELPPEDRAKHGVFLAFQSPIAIPGVNVVNLLRTAYQQIHADTSAAKKSEVQNPLLARRWQAGGITLAQFTSRLKELGSLLRIDETFFTRGIHDGFSGGEKKKIEMLQALVLQPKFAIFDEIDTGLDVDALKIVAEGMERLKQEGTGVLVITHYQRILKYVKPDVIHVLVKGKMVDTGDASLAQRIEEQGYKKYLEG